MKVKALINIPNCGISVDEIGKVIDDYKETTSGNRMRAVEFKKGGYAVFGDNAFEIMLKEIK